MEFKEDDLINLADELNMEYSGSIGGQRVFGPPKDWQGPVPPRGTEVHVGCIPRSAHELTLLPIFMEAGRVYTFRLMLNFSGDNRGYCFVKYVTHEDAVNAIVMLNGEKIGEKTIKVKLSVENRKLFIQPLPPMITTEEAYKELKEHLKGIVKIAVKNKLQSLNPSDNMAYAFVEFKDHRHAAVARKSLLETDIQPWNKPLNVDWSNPTAKINQHRTLCIRNVNRDTSLAELKGVLNKYGNDGVLSIRRKSKFVHVNFDSHANALKVLHYVHGLVIHGNTLTVDWKNNMQKHNSKCRTLAYNTNIYQNDLFSGGKHSDVPMAQLIPPNPIDLQTLLYPEFFHQLPITFPLFPAQPYQNPQNYVWSPNQPQTEQWQQFEIRLNTGALPQEQAVRTPLILPRLLLPPQQQQFYQHPIQKIDQPPFPQHYFPNDCPEYLSSHQFLHPLSPLTLMPPHPLPTVQTIRTPLGARPQNSVMRSI